VLGRKIIAIAASTGGVDALAQIVPHFPVTIPPVVLLVHMAPGFTKIYATKLNSMYKILAKEAQSGDCLLQGQILVAPAGKHMKVVERRGTLSVDCFIGDKINHVMPSADVLFESLSILPRINSVGVILTGIGADGAKGLKMMRDNGAKTIGQNKETSTIYGMPKVAMDIGAVEYQLPLNQIASKILSLV